VKSRLIDLVSSQTTNISADGVHSNPENIFDMKSRLPLNRKSLGLEFNSSCSFAPSGIRSLHQEAHSICFNRVQQHSVGHARTPVDAPLPTGYNR
jgi:hypothetical protein